MKIIKIQFENINSLKGKNEIIFDSSPLKDAGLFAITGPTGSGKTSILDVICLALYNRTPRMGSLSKNIIDEHGSILTRNTTEARASVTYECFKGVFTSEWSISSNRKGNLRDYEMGLYDKDNHPFDLKKSQVPGKNAELIGLEYDQFEKSILLAQGAFSEFLNSKPKERSGLLEKITGTFIYRELGKLAYIKAKDLKEKIKVINSQIIGFHEQLLSEDEFSASKDKYQIAQKELEGLDKNIKDLEGSIKVKEDISRWRGKINKSKEDLAANKAEFREFEKTNGLILKKHNELLPYREELNKHEQLVVFSNETKKRLNIIDNELKAVNSSYSEVLKTCSKLIGKQVNEERAAQELKTFETTYNEIYQKREAIRDSYKTSKASFADFPFIAKKIVDIREPEDIVDKLKQLHKEQTNDLSKLNNELIQNPFFKANTSKEKMMSTISELKDLIPEKTFANQNLKDKLEEEKDILNSLNVLPSKIKKKKLERDIIEKELALVKSQQEIANLKASLEEHRKTLKHGEHCPLCGSTSHPWSENSPKLDIKTTEVTKLEHLLISSNEDFSRLLAEEDTIKSRQAKLVKEIKNIELLVLKLNKRIDDKKSIFPESLKNEFIKSIESVWGEFESKSKLLEDAKKVIDELGWILPKATVLINLKKEGSKLTNELLAKYSEERPLVNLMDDLQRKIASYSLDKFSLLKEQKQLNSDFSKNEDKLQVTTDNLLPKIHGFNYKTIADALQNLCSHQDAIELQSIEKALEKTRLEYETIIIEATKELNEKLKSDVDENLEELEKCLSESKEKNDAKKLEVQKLFSRVDSHKKNKNYIIKKEEEKSLILGNGEKWIILAEQIGDSKGDTFSSFAQELTLHQLILLANKRLSGLSERYRLAPPSNEDLLVIDQDMGNLPRSIKTLSGGETFIISLSLALALSDLASRNIKIESMFIDEGFGTLDPETLDQTIGMLEKLQANDNKSIGIISHVDALKERISTQIQLKPIGQGYSKILIVN